MDKFKQMIADRHIYAEAWKKRTGGMILTYNQPYMPEEIAYAAGMLPVRMIPEQKPDVISAKWLYGCCYPVKNMINQVLTGDYDYMDAYVYVEDCQWVSNFHELITDLKPNLLNHFMFFCDQPTAPTSKTVQRSEMNVFKKKVEEWTGKEITDDDLDGAIEIYNTNRRLLRRIYEMRKMYELPILGSVMMNLMIANQVMDKAEMNAILEKFIPELEAREPYEDRIRLMLVGSELFNAELEEIVESVGAHVVCDETDYGSSYFWNDLVPQKDRLLAIALRYLEKPRSAMKDSNWRYRLQHIFEMTENYMVDGVLIGKQLVCQPHGSDNYAVWKLLRERYIPFHFFERDTTLPIDDTKIRVEAFLDMLKPGITRVRGWNQPLVI
ncbi:MAG: 2-hydroxyacyl-CoA dehydratase [Peptococcaceae bacterium]|nr:2-hydroxyacyl-CoA dehydratase [Peptococcaceae bacterium]